MNLDGIDIEKVSDIAQMAGNEIMKVYVHDFDVQTKSDNSPLTIADKLSNDVIVSGLSKLYPDIPFISEETKLTAYAERKQWSIFWLIDPLDGTKEFIKKNGEFTVNIALIENGTPVLGVVYVPATGVTYVGSKTNGSIKNDGSTHVLTGGEHYSKKQHVNVVGSRSHLSNETLQFVEQLKAEGKDVNFVSSGSSLKLCLVAEGVADVYPRFGPTMEWDTAAAHAVALYAGRQVLNAETKQPLLYNKENLLNPWFIVE